MTKLAMVVGLLIVGCANAAPIQKPQPAPLQSSPIVNPTQVPTPIPRASLPRADAAVQRDLTYCSPDGVALKMDLYFPPKTDSAVPGAVFVHGGAWMQGDKSGGNVIPVDDLASQGFMVAAVNYRLAPKYKFPAMIQDVKCAVRFLRANAARLNLDPNRIGVWGGSAGGHLVALLGTSDVSAGFDVGEYAEQSSRVQAVVDMFGPADLTLMFPKTNARVAQFIFGDVADLKESTRLMSPVTYVTQDDPPFLILQGDKDNVVPPEQSQIMYERLTSAHVPARLVMVKNAGHGFVPMGGAISPSRDELIRMIREFFVKNLK